MVASTAKQAMLLCPRFGAYKNLPEGAIWICEQLFLPSYPAGSVGTVCNAFKLPVAESNA